MVRLPPLLILRLRLEPVHVADVVLARQTRGRAITGENRDVRVGRVGSAELVVKDPVNGGKRPCAALEGSGGDEGEDGGDEGEGELHGKRVEWGGGR